MGLCQVAVCEGCGNESWKTLGDPSMFIQTLTDSKWMINDERHGTLCDWCAADVTNEENF